MSQPYTITTIKTLVQLAEHTTVTGKKEWYLIIYTSYERPQDAQVIKIRQSEYRKILNTQQ